MAALALGAAGAFLGSAFGPLGASIGWSLGSALGNALFPQHIDGPRLQDLKLHTSSYGQTTPLLYGMTRVAGNVIDEQPELTPHEQTSGGKGGPEVTNTTYTVSFAVRLGEGLIKGVRRIWANGRLIRDPTTGVGNDLPITIYLGTENQLPDPTLETIHGAGNVPGYRGVAYVVFTDLLLTDFGDALPNLNFEVYTSLGTVPIRVSTFNPAPGGLNGIISASYDAAAGVMTVGTYINGGGGGHPPLSYSQYQFKLDGTSFGVPIVDQLLDGAPTSGPSFMVVTNACIAAVNQVDPILGGAGAPAWYINGLFSAQVTSGAWPVARGVVLTVNGADYLYCANTDAGINRYPMTGGVPATDPDINVAVGGSAGDLVFGASDIGRLYVFNGAALTVTEYDANLSILHTWVTADFPAGFSPTSINGNNGFVRYNNLFAFSYAGLGFDLMNLVSIAPDNTLSLYPQPRSGTTPLYGYTRGPVIMLGTGNALGVDGVTLLSAPVNTVKLSDIVADLSHRAGLTDDQIDVTDLTDLVDGYFIPQQATARDMLQPLRDTWAFDAVERDGKVVFVKRGKAPVVTIPDDDLAAHVDSDAAPPILGLVRAQEVDLPAVVNVNYVNAAADYQSGSQAERRQVTLSQAEVTLELQISMSDAKAKSVAGVQLYEAWAERNRFTVYTSRKYARYEPTDVIVASGKRLRIVEKSEVAAGVIKFDGVASLAQVLVQATKAVPGSGFTTSPPTPTPAASSTATNLALLDLPLVTDADAPNGFYAGMDGKIAGWPGAALFESTDGGTTYGSIFSESSAQVLGTTTSALPIFLGGNVFDEASTVTVVTDGGQLSSATADAVLNGANPIAIGAEELNYKKATLIAANTYVLSGFLRGRRGTERAMAHAVGERFMLMSGAARIAQPLSELNLTRSFKPVTFGATVTSATAQPFVNTGASLKPYTPVLLGGGTDASGNVTLNWTLRTRIGGSWAPFADVQQPDSSNCIVQIWNADYTKCARIIPAVAPTTTYTGAQQVSDFGANQQTIYFTVGQIGSIGLGYQARGTAVGAGGSSNDPLAPISPYQSPTSGSSTPPPVPNALTLSMGWANIRKLSSSVGTFNCSNVLVASFTTPAGHADGVIGWIAAVEWIDQPVFRVACLSTVAGDFSGTALSRVVSQGPTCFFSVGTNHDGYPQLAPSTTYYMNVKNDDGFGACTCLSGSCGVAVELTKPFGL